MANVRHRLLDGVAGSRPVCPFLLPSLCAIPSSYLSISPPSYYFLPSFPISPGWHIEHVGASVLAVVDAGDVLVTV